MKMKSLQRGTIPHFLYRRAKKYPNQIAYSFPELNQHFTWLDVWKNVQVIANSFLRLGVKKGDTLAIMMPDRIELILCIYSAACIGAIAVPLNTYCKRDELVVYLKDSCPTAMIIGEGCHGLNYQSLMNQIIHDYKGNGFDEKWLPEDIFVVGTADKIQDEFRSYKELLNLGVEVNADIFESVCQSIKSTDPIVLLYTSGTTGVPKGVLRTTTSFLTSLNNGERAKREESVSMKISNWIGGHYAIMNLLPLYHLGGIQTILTNLKDCNIRIVMLGYFNPIKVICLLEKESPQVLVGTPFMILRIISLPEFSRYKLSTLMGVVFSSSAVSRTILQRTEQYLKPYFFLVGYGSSEAGAVSNGVCFIEQRNLILSIFIKILTKANLLGGLISYKEFESNPYSLAGKVNKSVEVKIVDQETMNPLPPFSYGEILIRSHRVMRYYRDKEYKSRFIDGGWFKSGDLGYLDDKGYLTIIDRLNRIISRGGEKISPLEVENIILTHNDVEEVFVLGIPDEMYGEELCACVVVKSGKQLRPNELRDFLNPILSSFKIPRYFVFLPYLPLSSTGKISIDEIQALVFKNKGVSEKNA